MDDSASRQLIERYVYVWNTGNLHLIDEICTPDVVIYYPGRPDGIHGREAVKHLIGSIRTIIPDLELRVDEEFTAGDRVVLRWSSDGIQSGRWNAEIPATVSVSRGRASAFTGLSGDKSQKSARRRIYLASRNRSA